MGIYTSIDIKDGYFGRWDYVANGKKRFKRLGQSIRLEDIFEDIETQQVYCQLSFDSFGETRTVIVEQNELTEPSLLTKLMAKGANLSKQHFDALVDSLRIQIEAFQQSQKCPVYVYSNLGWIQLPVLDAQGRPTLSASAYRAGELIGPSSGTYIGKYLVEPAGSHTKWIQMVKNVVLGNIPMVIALLAAIVAIIVGLIGPMTNTGNPIFHLFGVSSSGKTTVLFLAVSLFGKPFLARNRSQFFLRPR